jgi:hypothetical protein
MVADMAQRTTTQGQEQGQEQGQGFIVVFDEVAFHAKPSKFNLGLRNAFFWFS